MATHSYYLNKLHNWRNNCLNQKHSPIVKEIAATPMMVITKGFTCPSSWASLLPRAFTCLISFWSFSCNCFFYSECLRAWGCGGAPCGYFPLGKMPSFFWLKWDVLLLLLAAKQSISATQNLILEHETTSENITGPQWLVRATEAGSVIQATIKAEVRTLLLSKVDVQSFSFRNIID